MFGARLMSVQDRRRRSYTEQFKAKVAEQLLKGEAEIEEL